LDFRQRGRRAHAGQAAELPVEGAGAGKDVAGRSPMDHSDVQGRIGRRETRIEGPLLIFARQAPDLADDVGRGGDRIGAERGQGGMRLVSGHQRAQRRYALVGVGDLHHRRFADDHRARPRLAPSEPADQVRRSQAGRLLVVAQRDVDRALQRRRLECWDHRQHAGAKPLHVAGAAAVKPSVRLAHREGVARPDLTLDRHDVGVTRQDDAAVDPGPDRRQERGLVAGSVRRPARSQSMRREIVFDEGDNRYVRPVADAVEGDEARQNRLGLCETVCAHREGLLAVSGGRGQKDGARAAGRR
jgi:hypothetical protein